MTVDLPNYSDNFRYSAASIHHPTSVAEVQELVATTDRVKALGTRHSFTNVADTPNGALISLAGFEDEITIHPDKMTASVTPGTSYGIVAAALEAEGYALANMASLPHISIAGGTATGTHGSGDGNGILATSIAAVDLVTADGSMVTIDRSNPDLAAVAVGLGAFGIITRVELDVQPSYRMRQDIYRQASWESVLASLDEVMASAYAVCLMVNFGHDAIRTIWQKQRLDTPLPPAPDEFHRGILTDDRDLPADHSLNPRAGIPGPWSERLAHFRLDAPPSKDGDELQSEYYVGRTNGRAALEAMLGLGDRIEPHLHASEIRTAAADELWLSPAYQRETLCIGFTWKKHPAEVTALLPDIEAALEPFEPRPHWGKLFAMGGLESRFPRLPDFLELVASYDPTGKFWNPFLDRLKPSAI